MSETKLPLTVESNWQAIIDQRLQERLMRPLVQPGLTNTTQLATVIISRSHRLSNRLPLLTEFNQRLSNVTPLQAEQTPIVYAQPLPSLDKDFKSLASQEGSSLQNSIPNKSLIVQAKFAPSGEVNYPPEFSQNSSRVGKKNEVTQLTISEFQRKDGLEKNLIKENLISSRSQLAVNGLPIVQAKFAPSIEPTSPSPTSPNSQIYTNPIKSSLPVLQVENGSHSWLEPQSLPLLKQQTGESIFTTAISNTTTAATSKLSGQFKQLHVSSNGAEAVTDEHHKPPSLPVVTQMRMTGWTGLETPLILPTSSRSLEVGIAANGSQEYSAGVKPEILRATEGRNAGTVSRPAATVSQSAVPNVSAIAGFQESSSSPATTGNQTQIDMDVLADKIERKLMRRLVVENERRGQKRWR